MDLKALIEQKGEDWAVAAIVDGSIGYYTPLSARMVVKAFLKGATKCWSERCIACFKGDLEVMLMDDFQRFLHLEEIQPDRVPRILNYCKEWERVDTDPLSTISMLYPTLNI
jgi:hypothetical protein